MRSIGKRNITKLKQIVIDEMVKGRAEYATPQVIRERIDARIPSEWYDIWESAHDEIERVVSDEVMRVLYAR